MPVAATGSSRRPRSRAARDGTVRWLLEGDPSIRWQTLRDLVGASSGVVERERRRVARTGWGAALLRRRDARGGWAAGRSGDGGLYSPKWISTTYTMLVLRDLGLSAAHPTTRKACALLLDGGFQRDGGLNYGWGGKSETCITGMGLSILSRFGHDDERVDTLADHVLARQMPDGGWNCQQPWGATHSSVHTTISALEGLADYEATGRRPARAVRAAQKRGREFLLRHRLFRSHRTGAVIHPILLRLSYPPRWHYDVLRALDHFRAVGAPRDPRLADAIEVVRRARRDDGRWSLENRYRGRTWFEMERLGAPSRWNTLRALRVLEWWEGRGERRSPKGASRR